MEIREITFLFFSSATSFGLFFVNENFKRNYEPRKNLKGKSGSVEKYVERRILEMNRKEKEKKTSVRILSFPFRSVLGFFRENFTRYFFFLSFVFPFSGDRNCFRFVRAKTK